MFLRGLLCALLLLAGIAARPAVAKEVATPPSYRVLFATSKGDFVVAVTRSLAPHGADRLYGLVRSKHFDGARFFRIVPGFVVQWGYAASPAATQAWTGTIPDDPVRASNTRGTLTFAATSEKNSRSQDVFINLGDNARLDALGFAPLGKVVRGMKVVDELYSGYGEAADQEQIAADGNTYLLRAFPKLDYIKTARIVP